jgi:thiol-disulfide isomerase/thioredoxin
MRNIKDVALFLFAIVFLIACNKEQVQKQSDEKMNQKKEALQDKTNTENKEVSSSTSNSNLKLYKVEKVEKGKGKKVVPNLVWSEGGTQKSINDLKGNVILINLWATWCGPCIKEMPSLSKISEDLKDKNFKMIGLNIFQQPGSKKVEDFLKTNPVSYVILDGNQEVVDAFSESDGSKIEAIPMTFIVDKNGKIAETIVGGRDEAQ